MARFGLHSLTRLLCVLVMLLTSSLAHAECVLCFEADGRVEIERATIDGRCNSCPEHRGQQTGTQSLTSHIEACCTDVPIPGIETVVSRPGTEHSSFFPAIIYVGPPAFLPQTGTWTRLIRLASSRSAVLPHLATPPRGVRLLV